MITKKDAREILNIALSRGGDFAEIFMERSRVTAAELIDGKIEKLISGQDQGVGIRLVDGEKTYFLNSNRLDSEFLLEMAKTLADGVAKQRIITAMRFQKRDLAPFSLVKISPAFLKIARKIAILARADRAARAYDQRIIQVNCIYQDKTQDILVANSEGVFDTDRRVYPALMVIAIAKEGPGIQTGMERIYGTCGFELFDECLPEKVGQEAARSAIFQLEAKPAPAGTYEVVIMAKAGGGTLIHEAVGHGLEADLVEKGSSAYAGKVGQKVASGLITVADDRTMPSIRGTAKIDDEGSPCEKTILIEKGILVRYLQDRKFARKMGALQNGHGRRESFRHLPIPRMGNTMILPGKTPPQEIVDSLKSGVLITKMGGAGEVDPVSGNFVFSIDEAYLVQDEGRTKMPIRGATLVGNGPKILEEIDMAGDDLGFDAGTCGKGQLVPIGDAQPTIRIPQIVMGGIAKEEKDG